MSRIPIDLSGKRFNRLVVVSDSGLRQSDGQIMWNCICDCGKSVNVSGMNLRHSNVQSCKCLRLERSLASSIIHGQSYPPTSMYARWCSMKQRCYNYRHHDFKNYGGRGIAVCRRWRNSFENFLRDMGEIPNGKSIDRIDNNQGYGPWNCRWATPQQQTDNRRINKWVY